MYFVENVRYRPRPDDTLHNHTLDIYEAFDRHEMDKDTLQGNLKPHLSLGAAYPVYDPDHHAGGRLSGL